jgi:proline iminopeptidase
MNTLTSNRLSLIISSVGFFPRDGYLIEKASIDRIRDIPMVVVQGRYDVVCPPVSAADLKLALPSTDLRYTLAGHSGFEKENIRELVAATDMFKHNK